MSSAAAPAPRSTSQAKLVFFLVFGLLTAFVIVAKNGRFFDPNSPIAQHFAPARMWVILHGVFSAVAMVVAVFQFSNRLRARYLPLHRVLGYVYVTCVFIGAPLSLPVAMKLHGLSLVAATVVQSLGWMLCTGIAFYCVRRGNIAEHRRWMMRSYPFAMVFTVARLIIPIPAVFRLGEVGIETVVWTTVSLAAILPNVFLEWRAITGRPATRAAARA